jgi:competence protein ComEC
LLTGLSPSILRAATMFTMVVIGKSINRNTSVYNSLASSAFILLVINPYWIMDVGFQLSYLALIGIIFFQPKIYNAFYIKNWLLDKIWALASVAIAAQITTTPISLFYFHQFPNYFLITNVIAVPLSTVVTYIAILLIVVSPISAISIYVGKLLSFGTWLLNKTIIGVESIPFSLTESIQFNLSQTIILYVIIIFLSLFVLHKNLRWLQVSMVSIIVYLSIGTFQKFSTETQRLMIVYNIAGTSAINFIDGTDNIIFSDYQSNENKSKIQYNVKNNWINLGADKEQMIDLENLSNADTTVHLNNKRVFIKNNFLGFYNKRILYLNNELVIPADMESQKISIDYLILADNVSISIEKILNCYNVGQIIIDSSNSAKYKNKWIEQCKIAKQPCFSVIDQGAFQIEI